MTFFVTDTLPPTLTVGPVRPIPDLILTLTEGRIRPSAKVKLRLNAPFSVQNVDFGKIEKRSRTHDLVLP